MGKASRRRQARRAQYLGELAAKDPARFSEEWSKRLESWARVMRQNIHVLIDEHGYATPLSTEVVRFAEEQLAACGPKAVELEAQDTRECLSNECAAALASEVDGRSYRLTRTRRICDWAELYRTKLAQES